MIYQNHFTSNEVAFAFVDSWLVLEAAFRIPFVPLSPSTELSFLISM